MKILHIVLITFFGLSTFGFSQGNANTKSPQAIPNINSKNFSGLWYEVARTYNAFEDGCVAATVEYQFITPNKYKVKNRCFKEEIGGELIVFNGTAKSIYPNTMSHIKMTYFWIFSQEYKVVYLDDYKTAVMVDEEMNSVWIMNREPFLNRKKLDEIVSMLSKYMDTSKLIYTPQDKNGKYK